MGGLQAIKKSLIFLLLLAAVWEDIRRMRIPNRLIEAGGILRILLFLAEWKIMGGENIFQEGEKLAGSLLLVLGLFCFSMISQYGLGFGDIKLLGVITLYQGVEETLACLLFGLFPTAVLILVLLAAGRINRKDKLPLAPVFLMGYLIAMI